MATLLTSPVRLSLEASRLASNRSAQTSSSKCHVALPTCPSQRGGRTLFSLTRVPKAAAVARTEALNSQKVYGIGGLEAIEFGPLDTKQSRSQRFERTICQASKQTFGSFDEMIAAEDAVLVDFYATWCGPCQMLSKELASVSVQRKGKLKVVKIDTERYPLLASRFGVQALPTVVLFKQGKAVQRLEGLRPAAELLKIVDSVLLQTA